MFTRVTRLLLFLLLFALPSQIHAQKPAGGGIEPPTTIAAGSQCLSLDMVVLLDQSRSMTVNDPFHFRIQVLHHVMEYLADLSLFFCPKAQHRLAFVGFGDISSNWQEDVHVYLNTIIAPSDIGEWEAQRRALHRQVPQPEDLGSTDFLSAFRQAEAIFNQWNESPLEGPYPRRRVIFVITDGGPCVVDDGCLRDSMREYNLRAAMQEIKDYIEQHFLWRGEGSEHSVFILGIALNDQSYDYWTLVGDIWDELVQRRGGAFLQVPTDRPENTLLVRRVYNLLSLIAPFPFQTASCRQDIVVPPYRGSTVSFHIWRFPDAKQSRPPLTELILQTPDQVVRFHNGSANITTSCQPADYYQPTDYSERYLFSPACPGVYQVDIQNAVQCNIEVYISQGPAAELEILPVTDLDKNPQHPTPLPVVETEPFYSTVLKPRFRVRLYYPGETPTEHQPITPHPHYPIQFCVRVTRPDGQTQWYTAFRNTEPGIFESDNEFIMTPVEGTYQVEMFAFTRSPEYVIQGEFPTIADPIAFCEQSAQGDVPQGWLSVLLRTVEENGQVLTMTRSLKTTFEARAIPTFYLGWQQPHPDARTLRLGVISPSGEKQLLPLQVEVQILHSETGAPVDANALFSDPGTSLQANLFPANDPTRKVDIYLQALQPQQGLFVGELRPQEDWEEGRYILQVILTGDLKTNDITPATRELVHELDGYFLRQVRPELQPDEPLTFYQPWSSWRNFIQALQGQPLPLSFTLRFMHQEQAVPLHTLFEDPPASLEGTLQLPNGQTKPIVFQATGTEAFTVTLADIPPEDGSYQIHLQFQDLPWTDQYSISEDTTILAFEFTVQTPWYALPWTVRGTAIMGGLLVIALFGLFVYTCFRGPVGTLELYDKERDILVDAWTLSRFNCFRNRFRSSEIPGLTIKVTRSEEKGAIDAQIILGDGEVIDEYMESGYEAPLSIEGHAYGLRYIATNDNDKDDYDF